MPLLPRIFLASVLALVAAPARAQLIDGVAAIVGDDVVLLSELAFATQSMVGRAESQGIKLSVEEFTQVRHQALEGLIDQKLMLQLAESNNMETTESELDQAIEGIAGEEGVGVDEIYRAAATQGLDRESYREQLGASITRMKILSGAVRSRISVSDAELQTLFEERFASATPGLRYRVLHMLLALPPEATVAQHEQAADAVVQLRERALDTGDFAGLARQFSSAPTAAGGGMTVFSATDADPGLIALLEGLQPGEISPVHVTEHGLNLFQFLERFDPGEVKLEDVREDLTRELVDQKTMPEFEKWLADVRENRYIEIVHPDLK